MSEAIKPVLAQLADGARADAAALERAFGEIMDGAATGAQIGAFLALMAPHMRDPDALAAGARAMRARMVRVTAPPDAIDLCGTGGDGAHTLNISTAASFVVAGAGVPVAKHGNRAMSSRAGAADVLEALGVTLTADVAVLEQCLAEARIAFLFAQNHHPAMRNVAAPRRELGFRTVFNLLGPLSSPAGVRRQLVGVFAPGFVRPMADALNQLGAEAAWTIHGAGGLDELVPGGENPAAMLRNGAVSETVLLHGAPLPAGALAGGDAAHNANALRAVLANEARDSGYERTVLLNAAAALAATVHAQSLADGFARATESLRSGAAAGALSRLVTITGGAR